MGPEDSDQILPEVGKAPLIIDVDFLEEDDETLAQPLIQLRRSVFRGQEARWNSPIPTYSPREGQSSDRDQSEGRVGKTTTVINIAAQIALRGSESWSLIPTHRGTALQVLVWTRARSRTPRET